MDYCHPCGRHLNGALACPGCGTPTEPTHADVNGVDAHPHPPEVAPADTPEIESYTDDPSGTEGPDDGAVSGSRRDRKAAAHRRRRRRVLLITAGFLLAAGGLSLAELGTDAPFSLPRSASPGASAEGGADAEASGTAEPLDVTRTVGTDAGTGTTSPDPSASSSVSPSASKSPDGDDKNLGKSGRSATTGTGVNTSSAPTAATSTGSTDTPTSDPTTSDPSPTASPSETCKQVLWWCS